MQFKPCFRILVVVILLSLLLMGCVTAPTEAVAVPTAAAAATAREETVTVALATPTAAPTPVPTSTPAPTPFTVVWMSDTQTYALRHEDVFLSMADWIVANAEARDFCCVLHTGDVVDNRHSERQWETANDALGRVQTVLPMLVVAGNHDIGDNNIYAHFLQQPSIAATLDETQSFRGGEGAYILFSAGGYDFVAVGVGFSIETDFFDWANEVFAAYSDRVGILISHSVLNSDGSFTGPGKRLNDYVVTKSPNVRLVLCGHYRDSVLHEGTFDDDGTMQRVNYMMYNYQDDEINGLGYLRLLTFDPITRTIAVTTYSPFLDDYDYLDADKDTFLLADAF